MAEVNIDFKERHKYMENAYIYRNILLFAIIDKTINYDKYSENLSINYLARLISYDRRTVIRQMQQLKNYNVISVENGKNNISIITVNHYTQWLQPAEQTAKNIAETPSPKKEKKKDIRKGLDWL